MNKKGPPKKPKQVVTKRDFPITFPIRFYNSLYYRTRSDYPKRWRYDSGLTTNRNLCVGFRLLLRSVTLDDRGDLNVYYTNGQTIHDDNNRTAARNGRLKS